jgi:hypothetical protein
MEILENQIFYVVFSYSAIVFVGQTLLIDDFPPPMPTVQWVEKSKSPKSPKLGSRLFGIIGWSEVSEASSPINLYWVI